MNLPYTKAETGLALDRDVPKFYNIAINYLRDLFKHYINTSLNFKT